MIYQKEIVKEMDITIVPLYINLGGKQYKDTVELKEEDLYGLVEKHGELPKTAALSPADFHHVLRSLWLKAMRCYSFRFYQNYPQQIKMHILLEK